MTTSAALGGRHRSTISENHGSAIGAVVPARSILTEMILLRSAHWLQVTYLIVAVVILREAARQRRAMRRPAGAPRSPIAA